MTTAPGRLNRHDLTGEERGRMRKVQAGPPGEAASAVPVSGWHQGPSIPSP